MCGPLLYLPNESKEKFKDGKIIADYKTPNNCKKFSHMLKNIAYSSIMNFHYYLHKNTKYFFKIYMASFLFRK